MAKIILRDKEILPQLVDLFIYANAMPEERFLPVKDFESRFWVSDFGRIISCDTRRCCINFLHPHIGDVGYYYTQLRMKPKNYKVRVHTLVANHFLDADENRKCVNHIDGIKLNNYYKNLEYTTIGENIKHAVMTGLIDFKGEKHHNSKLTKEDVLEMRRLRSAGMIHKEIAAKFGITRRQAGDVVNGVNWGWLK